MLYWSAGFVTALALALIGSAIGGRADDGELDAASVRSNVAAATGRLPARERRTIDFTLDGLSGIRTLERSGGDYVETTQYGPLLRARGSIAGAHWYQNENGETVREEPDPGLAAREAYSATVRRLNADIVVSENLNAKGYGTRDYIDANTWLLQRRETIGASGTTTVTYDDYRTILGYTMAYHWTVSDGHPENNAEYRVRTEDDGPVNASDFAIPPARRELVTFPAGAASVQLPVRESHDRFIVRLTIAGHGEDFVLDTGASGIVIDDDVAAELNLTSFGAISNGANAGRYISRTVISHEIGVGDLQMHDVVMRTIPHQGGEGPGDDYRIVGLLGFDFIDALSLALDYQHGTVTATRPDAFVPPTSPESYPLEVRLGTGQPMTDVRINGSLGERFVLDTGAVGSVLVNDYFTRRYPGALVDEGHGNAQPQRYNGVGGTFSTKPFQVSSVQLGDDVRFRDFVVYQVTTGGSYGGNSDGLLGSELLKYFTMYTDYAHGKVYLEKNDFGRSALTGT